jgi:hypothetical protein
MCFVLYAGTSKPMPLKGWRNDAPDLSVKGKRQTNRILVSTAVLC